MEKERLVLILLAVVAFLLPVGVYCLILSSMNRRSRPVLVSGAWDSVGLLFAVSGFLLVIIPLLITEFYRRTTGLADGDRLFTLWIGHWAVWLAYFVFLASAGWLMILVRANKTVIYNVDLDQLTPALERTFALIGMEAQQTRGKLVLGPGNPASTEFDTGITESLPKRAAIADDHRHAELEVEAFASMCHVTLHWGKCAPGVRAELEYELHKNLEGAAPLENPAAGWFMTVSGLVLGAVTAIVLAMGFLLILAGR